MAKQRGQFKHGQRMAPKGLYADVVIRIPVKVTSKEEVADMVEMVCDDIKRRVVNYAKSCPTEDGVALGEVMGYIE